MTARPLRVVSLLPSATEIAVAIGLGENLVGRSHECDWPPEVCDLPAVSSTKLEKGLRSDAIDARVKDIVGQGLSVYDVDADLLRSLKPDVILTQSHCAVCAVTPADLEEALGDWLGKPPVLVDLAPDTLGDVWQDFRTVAAATGKELQTEVMLAKLWDRLDAIAGRSARPATPPTIATIEWIDPLMIGGNWIPELVRIAGGDPLLCKTGEHSPRIDFDTLAAADPDYIITLPCGFTVPQTLAELARLPEDVATSWRSLRAVREGRFFVTDGQYFFNRPGPRLVESAEILAEILDASSDDDSPENNRWVRASI